MTRIQGMSETEANELTLAVANEEISITEAIYMAYHAGFDDGYSYGATVTEQELKEEK